jgi:hypothetical protein
MTQEPVNEQLQRVPSLVSEPLRRSWIKLPEFTPPRYTLRRARAGFDVVSLTTPHWASLYWPPALERFEISVGGTCTRRAYRKRFVKQLHPTRRLPYTTMYRFTCNEDPTAPEADLFVGSRERHWPAALLKIRSTIDRFTTLSELEMLASAIGRHGSQPFHVSRVELAVDYPYHPGLHAELLAHLYMPRTRRRAANERWEWQALGSRRSAVHARNYEKQESDRLVHRLELSLGRGRLRPLGVTTVSDLRSVSWSEEFFRRCRFVAMRTDGIRDRDRVLLFFPERASFRGVNEALRGTRAYQKRIRRRFVDVPALKIPAAKALRRFDAQLRARQ